VLAGDTGAGKTALAAEVVDVAGAFGIATAWAGHAGGMRAPRLWAWQHVLRELGIPDETPTAAGRFELIQATATAVAELAAHTPVLIVLDDMHRADRLTLEVLELLAASIHRRPMLIVATWHDGGVDMPVHARSFDRLLSRCDVISIRLRGLDDTAIAELIEDVSGIVPTPKVVSGVRARTGGNPFYTVELVRMLHDSGRLDASTNDIDGDDVPDAVAGVIRRRMADLPRASRPALLAGATIGGEFDVVILADVLGAAVAEAADRLEPALRTGLLVEVADQPGRYRFPCGLVRDAVAAGLTGVARAQMHARIARVYADGTVSSAESLLGADHEWRAGTELDARIALPLID
jgi:predicted ATPase